MPVRYERNNGNGNRRGTETQRNVGVLQRAFDEAIVMTLGHAVIHWIFVVLSASAPLL